MSSRVDRLGPEKTTLDRKLSDIQYDYDGALAREKKVADALKSYALLSKKFVVMQSCFVPRTRRIVVVLDKPPSGFCCILDAVSSFHQRVGEGA